MICEPKVLSPQLDHKNDTYHWLMLTCLRNMVLNRAEGLEDNQSALNTGRARHGLHDGGRDQADTRERVPGLPNTTRHPWYDFLQATRPGCAD